MSIRLLGYILKALIVIVFYFRGKLTILPDSFVLWVWLFYIVNFYLTFYSLGYLQTAKDITRIYLSRRPGETDRNVQKMYSSLLPYPMAYIGLVWGV